MKEGLLYAPLEYWNLDPIIKEELCNGCGAKNGINVPDTLYGLSVEEACNIHDFMYKFGITKFDKIFADAMFLYNVCSIVINNSGKWLLGLRLARASKYFIAVALWGDKAYWVDKKLSDKKGITFRGEFK